MSKKLLYAFAAAAVLAGCAKVNAPTEEITGQSTLDPGAVNFGVYVNRNVTKAGNQGIINTTAALQGTQGFGVFAYNTNGELYSETSKPDFMYNQKVAYGAAGGWTYNPVKYWPNEFGTDAASEEVDLLTFFAYAPYVKVSPSTGIVDDSTGDAATGIIGMTRNTASGNPLIKYVSNLTPADGVDLLWGVAADDFDSSVDGSSNNIVKGEPFIDVMKPKTGDKIMFDFKHALAQLNVQIDTDVDAESHAEGDLDTNTKIYVRSVTFEGFTTKGALDLNSDFNTSATPTWYDVAGNGKLSLEPVTIYDGRRDGKEGVASAAAKNESPDDLNPVIVQSVPYDDAALSAGVTHTPVNLFNSGTLTDPVMVIPTGEPMKITIVYDVETQDEQLAGYLSDGAARGSSVENAILQEILLTNGDPMELESGKKYTVKLHLGLTSVKVDADVTAWADGSETDVDLPINNALYIASVTLDDPSPQTLWLSQDPVSRTVTAVTGSDGEDWLSKEGMSISWSSSDPEVASVDASTGEITKGTKAGITTITAKAKCDGCVQTASYDICVNAVTGVSITANKRTAALNGDFIDLTATLEHTNYGTVDVENYPDDMFGLWGKDEDKIQYLSQSTQLSNIDATHASVSASINNTSSVASFNGNVTATVNNTYSETAIDGNLLVCFGVQSLPVSGTPDKKIRGLWVSGLLQYCWFPDPDNPEYSILSSSDLISDVEYSYSDSQLADAISSADYFSHYFNFEMFNSFPTTFSINGADYQVPSDSEWMRLMNNDPEDSNGSFINDPDKKFARKHFATVAVDYGDGNHYGNGSPVWYFVDQLLDGRYYTGVLLFPDNQSFACPGLSVFDTYDSSNYGANVITKTDLEYLINYCGCKFIPAKGYIYSNSLTTKWDRVTMWGHYFSRDKGSYRHTLRFSYNSATIQNVMYDGNDSCYLPALLIRKED